MREIETSVARDCASNLRIEERELGGRVGHA
jgi:hypothetical protein